MKQLNPDRKMHIQKMNIQGVSKFRDSRVENTVSDRVVSILNENESGERLSAADGKAELEVPAITVDAILKNEVRNSQEYFARPERPPEDVGYKTMQYFNATNSSQQSLKLAKPFQYTKVNWNNQYEPDKSILKPTKRGTEQQQANFIRLSEFDSPCSSKFLQGVPAPRIFVGEVR